MFFTWKERTDLKVWLMIWYGRMLLAHLCWGGSGGIEGRDTVLMLGAEVSNKKREQTGNP